MKGNKIMATLVVLLMVLSTLVVLNKFNSVEAGATSDVIPGVDGWGNATIELVYNEPYTDNEVRINTSKWTGTDGVKCYLYYPKYQCAETYGTPAYRFSWEGPYRVSGTQVYVQSNEAENDVLNVEDITFNRSGMWIFDSDATHAGDDNTSYEGYIWVNTSNDFTIGSISDFQYGATTGITVSVTKDGSVTGAYIDLIAPDNTTVKHIYNNVKDKYFGPGNFTMAGDYRIWAYRDTDAIDDEYTYGDEGGVAYDWAYGSNYSGKFPNGPGLNAEYYDWWWMGPWDPPEENATEQTFTVETGEPIITLTNTTIYWGFETRIDVNITEGDGDGILVPVSNIKLKHGHNWYDSTVVTINNDSNGNYSIEIPRYTVDPTGWIKLGGSKANATGPWKVFLGANKSGDATEEWNGSAGFTVSGAVPPVQLIIVNDGGGDATDKKVDVPIYTAGNGNAATIDISFKIYGTSITDELGRAYYGDNTTWEDEYNITVEGDILYPAVLTHVGTLGNWTATVTPTTPGGTITLTIDWPGDNNGSASQTIEIVNGTYVTPAVDTFKVGADYNLTVTILDMENEPVKNAYIYLMWENVPDEFNDTIGDYSAGNGKNGEYTFWIRDDEQPPLAPANLTIAAKYYVGTHTYWGYAKVIMEKDHDMRVNVTPTTSYAGDLTLYDIDITTADGGRPSKTDDGGLRIALYNSTGDLVTDEEDKWSDSGHYDINDIDDLILSGGTYYLHAYNNTHDSQDYNATLVITKYAVTCSPSVLAWKIDTSTNMSFSLTPAGNGTLTLNNMSSLPNCSDVDVISPAEIRIENGVGTLDDVNATTLGNVTFCYTPDDGESRPAEGLLRITTATATPNPATIYIGEATTVIVTITHPATGVAIPDVRVGLDHGINESESMLSQMPADEFTDAAGIARFGVMSDGSGNITIYIENETDPDNPFVIVSAARKTMTITTDASVDERGTFTVEAKDVSGALITDATITITFAGESYTTDTGTKELTAPQVTANLPYTISAMAEGYTSDSTSITVINVPKLFIDIAGTADKDGKYTSPVTVVVSNDDGAVVTGVTVIFGTQTGVTVNGQVTFTVTKDDTYTVTATKTGFTAADQVIVKAKPAGIPGFELLTLVAAIGVAFLLLRRRQK